MESSKREGRVKQQHKDKQNSLLDLIQTHLFSLLFELSTHFKESFVETLILQSVFYFEYFLLFFAPWVLERGYDAHRWTFHFTTR